MSTVCDSGCAWVTKYCEENHRPAAPHCESCTCGKGEPRVLRHCGCANHPCTCMSSGGSITVAQP